MIKKIGVLTSGGDAPGMNAAIRAVVRTAITNDLEVYGIYDGYKGLYEGKIERLFRKSVSEKIHHGGTFLGTARLNEFVHREIREVAIENLHEYGIDALVTIGGDGTYRGALALEKMGVKCVGIPGTIDNDIGGTDYTIGFDTALNTVVDAVDKLRDTSSSHRRCSIIEVMGRNCGAIAIWTGISVGAEYVACKELGYDEQDIIETIRNASKSKRHAIVIITEHLTDVNHLAKVITENTQFEARSTVLGHIQRGGSPTPRDRVLASIMGVRAVEELMAGNSGTCICEVENKLVAIPLEIALETKKDHVTEKYRAFKMLW
ncbi:MAG: 6-phosphofructokinase [Bacilli bacterium]|jgi:6-phosphofructokinase 1|nr:6-phosphofructokinase [Bacilli bacterium]MDY0063850.1 6-phosphofructokinase [Bacilli bacterium]